MHNVFSSVKCIFLNEDYGRIRGNECRNWRNERDLQMHIFLMFIVNMAIHQHFNCHEVNLQYYYSLAAWDEVSLPNFFAEIKWFAVFVVCCRFKILWFVILKVHLVSMYLVEYLVLKPPHPDLGDPNLSESVANISTYCLSE